MKETAAGASWEMTAHVGLIATTTTDDILMVHDDEELCVSDYAEHAVRTAGTLRYTPLIDRSTQHHPLSAAINKRRSPERPCGTGRVLLSCVAVGGHDSATDG